MSIIDSFDIEKKALINPEDVYPKSEIKLDVCIINFSYKIMNALIEDNLLELIDNHTIKSISCHYPVYVYKHTTIGIVKTTVGAPITAGLIEEIGYVFSCSKFVLFGSCGSLDKTISPNKIIVPTHAYRDEGMSYHYVKASDYIDINNYATVSGILDKLKIDYVLGKTWTTDAFYRETAGHFLKRKKEGCIAVEMEVSACQAVANFRGYQLYNFLYRADNLDCSKWDRGILSQIAIDERLKHFFIALEIAKMVMEDGEKWNSLNLSE